MAMDKTAKIAAAVTGVLLLIGLVLYGSLGNGPPPLTGLKALAERTVDLYDREEYGAIYASFGTEVQNTVTREALASHLADLRARTGSILIDKELEAKAHSYRYEQFATAEYQYFGGKSSGRIKIGCRWDGGWVLIDFKVIPN